jgi:hypothetical protein
LRGKTQNNYIFQDLSELSEENMTKMTLSAFARITLMVISCNLNLKDSEKMILLVTKLLDKQKESQELKIIFLVENETLKKFKVLTDPKNQIEQISHNGLLDLASKSESQKLWLSNFTIKFQGFDTKLKKVFVDEDSKKKIYPEMLSRIIKQEEVSIGNDIPISIGYEHKLYLDR